MKNKRNILLVEGRNDLHVISNLCKSRNIPKAFEIEACNSKDGTIIHFDLCINEESTRYDSVGIVVDADFEIAGTWDKIKDKIKRSERYHNVPEELNPEGLTLEPILKNSPSIGVWVMPNNIKEGVLEDFVSLLANEEDELMYEAEQVLSSLEERRIQKYKEVHRAKAKIYTYLAWQDEPGKPMGQAITSKILNPNSDKADGFIGWLKLLFIK